MLSHNFQSSEARQMKSTRLKGQRRKTPISTMTEFIVESVHNVCAWGIKA